MRASNRRAPDRNGRYTFGVSQHTRKLPRFADMQWPTARRGYPFKRRQEARSTADFLPNDVCVSEDPTPQAAIDTLQGWVSIFPPQFEVLSPQGVAALFDDGRAHWAIEKLGGVHGLNVLEELGPLEGGHTYMLDRAGARSITAIEGNKRCYLKCLVTKELFGVKSANVLLGNFVPWLEKKPQRFDVIWATGVLYHMTEPVKLLKLLAERTDRLHIWTHFYPDEYAPKEPFDRPLVGIESRDYDGHAIPLFLRTYMGAENNAAYCGGVDSGSSWLRRSDILKVLERAGFSDIEVAFETPFTGNGPSFALVAQRR